MHPFVDARSCSPVMNIFYNCNQIENAITKKLRIFSLNECIRLRILTY